VPADSHTAYFLSPVIRDENGGSMPAAILREFVGKNQSVRCGVFGGGKNGSRFVRIPAAIVDVEIKPAPLCENLRSGFA
jgi:hypothetical protein